MKIKLALAFTGGIALGIALFLFIAKLNEPIKLISPIPETEYETETQKTTPTPVSISEPSGTHYEGNASFYTNEYCQKFNPDCLTASGVVFDDSLFTCACGSNIPLNSKILVTYQDKSIVVTCNDRGSFEKGYGRILDLSKAAFEALSPISKGVIKVEAKVL
jgi:Lipoproteins